MDTQAHSAEPDEFVTIIGADMTEITNEFRAQGLAEKQFAIVHKIGRHRFTRVDGRKAEPMFEGRPLIAATFQRRSNG
jgi:hypothetical protein